MPDVITGTLVDGRYKVLSRLGSGGMADVFLAKDEQLGRNVALKLLHRRFAADPGFVERFRREAQAAAGLQHPNVVSVYDRGAYDETYYIAMEYLPGRSLKELIRQEAPIDPIRAIDITIQILKAARFAHRRGVIHRDLKPHNVIIDDADQAKVTDFGIARAGASDMTETGSIMGTAQYLSPEQAQGHAVSAGSDLYSVGVVLYELLTARVPFDGEAAVTIALKHVSEAPPSPRAINPAIPPELEQVVLWALNKDPGDRPTDADQFIAALTQVREAILASGRGQQTEAMAALAAMPAAALGGAAVAGAGEAAEQNDSGSGSFAPVAPWSGDGTGDYETIPPERRRRPWPWLVALLVVLLAGGGVAAYLLTRPAQKVVPPVVGESVSEATTNIENAGFNPTTVNVPNTSASGTVIRQNPLAGTKLKQNATVTLTVSSGPGSISIPSVAGESEAQARKQLRQAGLKVRIEQQNSQTVATGDATKTDPVAGTPIQVGSTVTLFISTGKPMAVVPPVVSLPQGEAKQKLSNAGFKVSTSNQTSTTATPGTVLSQDPGANTRAVAGSTVNIVLARAPSTIKVPSVKGDALTAAENTLSAAGFNVQVQPRDVRKQENNGIVLAQSPGAGSMQKKGSTVTIVVGHLAVTPPPTTSSTSTPTTTSTTTPSTTATTPSTTTPTTTSG
jgi:serine/threonine-protein kinase